MKYALGIENFLGKKVNSIKQEYYANILTYNLSMMMCKPLIDENPAKSKKKKKKYQYVTNKRALLSKIKQCFVKIFNSSTQLPLILKRIVQTVKKESVPLRPNRKFKRSQTYKAKPKPNNRYNSAV